MRAFSLVELSIVLVILGLLTGGILTGQSLIRAAELRSVVSDFQRYQSAIYSFRDKYMALPGDFRDAHLFWTSAGGDGRDLACFTAQNGNSTATCGGNGDGAVTNAGNVSSYSERFSSWKHLANAGLVEGNYTGRAVTMGTYTPNMGSTNPPSRISNAFFDINRENYLAADINNFGLNELFNAINLFGPGEMAGGAVLIPEEAWNIDMKLDDGMPAKGSVLSTKQSSTTVPDCTTSDALDAAYSVQLTDKRCILRMRL